MMAYHQHVQMLIQGIYCIWHSRIGRRWQNISCCCGADDIRCMSSACTFCMICMDRSSANSCKCIFHTAAFIQSICMNGNLYIILICNIQAVIDNCRCCTPVFMDLQSHGTGFYLLDQRSFIRAVSFSKESKVHRIFFCCFQHHTKIPWARCTGSCIGSVCRACSSSDHGCNTAVQCTVDLLRTDEMDMGINTTGCNDHSFSCQCLCGCSDSHSRCHPIHDIRVSRFTDSCDLSIFDSDICLDDSCGIHDQGIGDNKIQITVTAAGFYRLSHSVTNSFTAAEFYFIAICGVIFLNLHYKAGVCKSYFVTSCRAVHHCIFFTGNFYAHLCPSL